ncbi:MAG TPA: PepSY-like domain-containing protein [Cyclobacteriaceae bacterium]|nr:PepSY-like domain-containing protein [Cyclobacteriaceae bacterium]HRE65711.1 PepSY-like domain-containing protein [Cyclobacteriaceae bacterium]HRF32460.1 PepSY-like domain-containing protein [Cyclobacteriaceae bacterium]
MKTLLIVLGLSLTMCQAEAQKVKSKDVPAEVKNTLQKSYAVTDADWDKEDGSFEANFELKGNEMSVLIDTKGNILEVETEIAKNELPAAVLKSLESNYKDFKIEETARIEANGVVTYEVEVEKGKQSFDLIFDLDGVLIEKLSKETNKD